MAFSLNATAQSLEAWWVQLSHFPWRTTAHMLRERFREDRLGVTASSLTFTTLLALVPFFTVALAVFAAFPIFGKMQLMLQRWLIDSLVPDSISRPVLGYLTQFAAKAGGLGAAGFSILMVTALALILTIDRTLNGIWRVRRLRPLGQRVLIYWAAMTLGPLVLAASLALTTAIAGAASRELGATLPGGARLLLDAIEFLLLAAGVAAMYRYVPNTQVHWRDAWAGSLFVSLAMELAKKGLGLYLAKVPTYSVIYGTFATLPILLLWIYMAWVIVLLGAVVAAYMPSLDLRVRRREYRPGWRFVLALELLGELARARQTPARGMALAALCERLRLDPLQAEPVLEVLQRLDWIGLLAEDGEARHVLLAEPAATPLAPLVERLLLAGDPLLQPLQQRTGLSELTLADALARPGEPDCLEPQHSVN